MNSHNTTLNDRKKATRSLNLLAAAGITAIILCAAATAILHGPDKSGQQSVQSTQS